MFTAIKVFAFVMIALAIWCGLEVQMKINQHIHHVCNILQFKLLALFPITIGIIFLILFFYIREQVIH